MVKDVLALKYHVYVTCVHSEGTSAKQPVDILQ